MRFFTLRMLLLLTLVGVNGFVYAQTTINRELLKSAAADHAQKQQVLYERLQLLAREKGWPWVIHGEKGKVTMLVGVDDAGLPLYLSTENNTVAAATIGTNHLWPGGSTGLNLNGSSNNIKGKLAVWDGGRVRESHVELVSRVTQKDNPPSLSAHSTHVAGTLIASGVNPNAKGMSFGLQELLAYDFTNDEPEMMAESPNLLISNHSYGFNAGWNYNTNVSPNRWEFLGRFGENEDYKFGYYSTQAQLWDSIAYNSPYHLIFKSAGNVRELNGPAVGQPYWRYNASGVMAAAGNRPPGISSNDSYDILSLNAVAKNIMVIGAVRPIDGGYTKPQDVEMSTFSGWGPTDDGRIKPDVVADGVNLLSSVSSSDNAYDVLSGTSMAAPSAAGSLLLLQEYYSQIHSGTFMRSATLKGLAIHTTDEAGDHPGPDYRFGWGLLNLKKAAAVITAENTTDLIQEHTLNDGASFSLPVIASGSGTLVATLSWTDPKATVEPLVNALNNPAKKLVNDLDIVVKRGTTVYQSWRLNPAVPSAAATRGDNDLDNVEKVELSDVVPGESYTIEVTHKGTLQRGAQAFSLIVSGVGGAAYCNSSATSNAGARIDSVSFSNIQQKNSPGCTSYTSYTNLTAQVQSGQTIPFFVRLNSCDASNADKIVKVFIDANNDGDFTDAGELVGTSTVISGNGDYTGNITLPTGMVVGRFTILRIVMQETSNAADVNACGTYTRGETQDYRITVVPPSNDAGISELVSPQSNSCASTAQYVTLRLRNYGSVDKTNIPITVEVKQGATTVATLNGTFGGTLPAGSAITYTLPTPFTSAANTTYTLTCSAVIAGDQEPNNNQLVATVKTAAASADPTGSAVVCGSGVAQLSADVTGSDVFTWYNPASPATPIAVGANVNTPTVLPNYLLGKNIGAAVGPATKDVLGAGGYDRFQNYFVQFNTAVPLVIETVRLYIGNSSVTNKLTITLGRNFSFNSANGTFSYIPEATTTLDIFATDPTPAPGPQPGDPNDPGAVFYLNLPVTTVGDHVLIISQAAGDNATFFRNNNVTGNPYPIGIPGIFTFTNNTASYTTPPGNFQNFYYFFYDVRLKFSGCPSSFTTINTSTLTAPTISINGNVLTSTAATGNQWMLNGTPIVGATSQTFTATVSGNYTVQVSSGSCTLTSNEINFIATAVPNVDPAEIGLAVTPNPAKGGQFNVRFETRSRADLDVALMNTSGQAVYREGVPGFTGKFNKTLTPSHIAAGVYYLRIMHDNKMYIKKVVVVE